MASSPESATTSGSAAHDRGTEAATDEREAWSPVAEVRTDPLSGVADRLARSEALDDLAEAYARAAAALPRSWATALRGEGTGHPVHPMLVDLPIGFWTSGWVLDLVGGRRGAPMARRLIGLGVLAAVPAFASGIAEFEEIDDRGGRRVAAFHAASNATATGLFALSWRARRSHRALGMVLAHAGAVAATLGGALGGHLAFALGVGQTPHRDPGPADGRSAGGATGPAVGAGEGLASDLTETERGVIG